MSADFLSSLAELPTTGVSPLSNSVVNDPERFLKLVEDQIAEATAVVARGKQAGRQQDCKPRLN